MRTSRTRRGTYEDYVGARALDEFGKKAWRKHVEDVVESLVAALQPDDVVLGGGNAKKLKELPPLCRLGRQRERIQRRISDVGRSSLVEEDHSLAHAIRAREQVAR